MSSSANKVKLVVEKGDSGLRLDQFLAARIEDLSRRKARVLIDIGGVFIDRSRVKVAGRKVRPGQVVEAVFGGALDRATKKVGRDARSRDEAEQPAHEVVFEDDDVIVVAKPPGLLTAPTPESDRNNLADTLARERGCRVFVVHRLDLDTSGVLVFAKTDDANRILSERFRSHDMDREYLAVVEGTWPEGSMEIEDKVAGKSAKTTVTLVEHLGDVASVVRARLYTGRNHQVRLHCTGRGHPVMGDRQHGGGRKTGPRLALHATLLGFVHPRTGEQMRFERALPPDLVELVDSLRPAVG